MEKKELFSRFSVFSDLSAVHLQELGPMVKILEFDAGTTIFNEGEKGANFYGLLEGEVELVLVTREAVLKADIRYEEYDHSTTENVERDIIVDSIEPYEIFGWSALSPEGRYTSKAVCAEPTKVFTKATDELLVFFAAHPEAGYPFMLRLLKIVSSRFDRRSEKLVEGWGEAFKVNRI